MSAPAFTFNFPRTIFVDQNKAYQQLNHVYEELCEAREAILKGEPLHRVVEECLDLHHSCETLLNILVEQESADLDEAAQLIEIKNRERGYYGN